MIEFKDFFTDLSNTRLHFLADALRAGLTKRFEDYTHGELDEWVELLKALPQVKAPLIELKSKVSIGQSSDLDQQQSASFKSLLMNLHPWRKGPFDLFGTHIDTEWRSDWKWDRLLPHISPLKDRLVLDVGCGNGYHCFRMLGEQAQLVLGIDPSQKFLMQFQVFKQYLKNMPVHLLPIGIEYLPESLGKQGFDTVFSMGVLYHRRSPIEHLQHLKNLTRPGGELILETLVVEGDENTAFIPTDRYAQMRNVWFLPSALALEKWLKRLGFSQVKTVDVNQTSVEEQRATDWMTFHSLSDYLAKDDINKTIEGHPAPKRAIIVATN